MSKFHDPFKTENSETLNRYDLCTKLYDCFWSFVVIFTPYLFNEKVKIMAYQIKVMTPSRNDHIQSHTYEILWDFIYI